MATRVKGRGGDYCGGGGVGRGPTATPRSSRDTHRQSQGVNQDDLCPVCGLICVVLSCYPKWPECIGAAVKGQFLCCEIEQVLCKTGRTEGSICMCLKTECEVIKPTVCVKMTKQVCCLDLRCALPHDEEVPCICTILGLQCMKNYECDVKCSAKLGNTEEPAADGAPPAPDAVAQCEMMDRTCVPV